MAKIRISVQMTSIGASKLRILVVDDEPAVGETVKMLLNIDGHEVETSNSSTKALVYLNQAGSTWSSPICHARNEWLSTGSRHQGGCAGSADRTDYRPCRDLAPVTDVDFVVGKPFLLENLREAIAKVMPEESLTPKKRLPPSPGYARQGKLKRERWYSTFSHQFPQFNPSNGRRFK